jgi:hypothetical protein
LQRQSALHGVEPKREISSVLLEPQRGHSASVWFFSDAASAPLGGGAMPYARSFSRPSSLIQSVDQGGESVVAIATSPKPFASSAARIDCSV